MLRLVRTTTENEGRFTESWALVDSDDELEPWPANAALAAVGRPTPRLDGAVRVSGAARYTVDVALPGMLHAAVLRSPLARARVTNFDVDAARAVAGVRAVLGPGDGPPTPHADVGFRAGEQILRDDVEYGGQPVAAVAADTPAAATAGLRALAPVYEPLPFTIDVDDALNEQRFVVDPTEIARGDSERALAAADVRVELTIETPSQLHVPLEPHAAVADWRPDGLTVWLSTQAIAGSRDQIARAFDLPRDHVRVIAEFVGGAFGSKTGPGVEALLAADLSRLSGRPVRLVNDRHAEQLDTGRRAWTRQTVRLGADRDGTLVAVEADVVVSAGLGGFLVGQIAGAVVSPALTLYRCENATAMTFPVRLNLRTQNALRAPGAMEGTAVLEQAIDELASELGMDPLDLRRHNHVDFDQRSGLPYSDKRLLECYDRAAALSGWRDRERLRSPQPDGLLRGQGCATQIWGGLGGPPARATVRISSDGVATVVTGMQDTGTGTLTGAQLVAAEELGFEPGSVRVLAGDTARGVHAPVAGGSMTTPSVMPAVRAAAGKARKLLLQLASDMLEISPDELSVAGGRIRSVDHSVDVPVLQVTEKLGEAVLESAGSRGPNPDQVRVQSFGCQIAQVAVDAGTGEIRVEHVWAVHDIGRVINPLTASSQVEGGILQGLGFALFEEIVVDPTTGLPTNATFDDYKVPTIADTPEITVEFIDVPDDSVPNVGAKGLGEPPIIPTAGAIANAVAHATGRRCPVLPLTRRRMLEVLR
jgi:CO/xanthine dehydrogenase Mo-binding subunit